GVHSRLLDRFPTRRSSDLFASRIRGKSMGQEDLGSFFSKGSSRIPRSLAMVWREQLPLRTQVAHWQSCWDRISSTLLRRLFLALDRKSTRLNSSHVSISYA